MNTSYQKNFKKLQKQPNIRVYTPKHEKDLLKPAWVKAFRTQFPLKTHIINTS